MDFIDFPEAFTLEKEDADLAQRLGELGHGDFARMMTALSERTKKELEDVVRAYTFWGMRRKTEDDEPRG